MTESILEASRKQAKELIEQRKEFEAQLEIATDPRVRESIEYQIFDINDRLVLGYYSLIGNH